jgi:hypothetical protein
LETEIVYYTELKIEFILQKVLARKLLRDIRPWNGSVSGASSESNEHKITAIRILVLKVQSENGEILN